MTDTGVQLWLAALTILTLAALGIAGALWWRTNQTQDEAATRDTWIDQQLNGAATDLTELVAWTHAAHPLLWPEPAPDPTAVDVTDEPPTAPVTEVLDAWRTHFTFTQGGRP